MKEKELIEKGLADLAYKAESDHEVQMARADLYKIAKYAIQLHEMMKNVSEAEGLEGWVQSKITKAADYMGAVYHHMDYERKFEEVQETITQDAVVEKEEEKEESGFTDKQIKQAFGVLNDKRFKGGNYTGAVEVINKIAPGLADHPSVAKALKKTNEDPYKSTLQMMLERKLSKGEDKKKEKFVKGMKKAKGDFKDRYGKDAEAVMYATATKMAKNESKGLCKECGKPSYKTLPEEKQKGVDGKVCWKGYKRMGTKKKGGKTVDNCVKM